MAAVTLSSNYVRKIARSYKELRNDMPATDETLSVIKAAAERCINAHMRAELSLASDVILPMGTVLMMLQYVHREASERLTPVPQPQDFEPQPVSEELRPFLVRAIDRLKQAVAA